VSRFRQQLNNSQPSQPAYNMTTAFERILRIRSLLEDASRADLERQAHQVTRVEEALRHEAEAVSQLCIEGFVEALNVSETHATPIESGWISKEEGRRSLAEIERQIGIQKILQLKTLAQRENQKMFDFRQEFLKRRKERRQIEILVDAQIRMRSGREQSREQRALDEWFASTWLRLRRGEKKH
jgi:hypothetical protein